MQPLRTFVWRGDELSARSAVLFLFHAGGDSPRFKFIAAALKHAHVTRKKKKKSYVITVGNF